MARRWMWTASVAAWLGLGFTLQAQTPPPPVPIGASGGGMPMMMRMPAGQMPASAGPMAPWTAYPGAPGGPPAHLAGPGGMCPEPQGESLDLDAKTVNHNAFNGDEGPTCRPLAHQLNLEYLQMWYSGHRHIPLVTTGDIFDLVPGALDQPNTIVLHGNRTWADPSAGFRATYTYWLVDPDVVSLDTSFFIMEHRRLIFATGSDIDGNPVISRPFFDPTINSQSADPRALPFIIRGSVEDNFVTELMGAEANLKYHVTGSPATEGMSLTIFTGPRWLRLEEQYYSNDASQDLPPGIGESRVFRDSFECRNEFFGGQVGSTIRGRWDRLTLDLTTKVAAGTNFQRLKAFGSTLIHNDFTGAVTVTDEGLYVQSTNAGVRRREVFSVIPEISFNAGFFITENLKFNVGYGAFNMNNVLRPGAQIDPLIEIQPSGIPTTHPVNRMVNTDFWAQWVNFGLEFVF